MATHGGGGVEFENCPIVPVCVTNRYYRSNPFSRIKHHLIDPEVTKGLPQVIYQGFLLPMFHHNIIHISLNIAPNLFMKTILNTALMSRICTLEPKRHGHIAEGSKGSYETSLLLVLNCHFDMMVTRIRIHKTQTVTTRRSINNLINMRESKGINWTGLVQVCVIHTHTPSVILLKNQHRIS